MYEIHARNQFCNACRKFELIGILDWIGIQQWSGPNKTKNVFKIDLLYIIFNWKIMFAFQVQIQKTTFDCPFIF